MTVYSSQTLLGIFPWWVEFPTELGDIMKPKDITEQLSNLHANLAGHLATLLESGEATVADLNVIRQFLKDNQITAQPAEGSAISDLAKALPYIDKVVAFKRKSA